MDPNTLTVEWVPVARLHANPANPGMKAIVEPVRWYALVDVVPSARRPARPSGSFCYHTHAKRSAWIADAADDVS